MNITRFFLKNGILTNLLIILVIIAGLVSVFSLPRQDSPNVNFDILTITTLYPGASPEDVEINVTDLIEDELEKVDGIEEMASFSVESMSNIFIQLSPDSSDTAQVKNDIRSAVDRVTNLPAAVETRPLLTEMKSTDFPVIEVAIIGKNASEETLRKIAKDMESEIKSIGHVGNITKVGYRKKEVKILCDNNKLRENYVSFGEILTAIKSRNVKLSGGTVESFVDEKKIVTFSEFEDLTDVKDVIVRSNFSGKYLKVSDIADVKVNYEKKKIISRTNGIDSINLIIKRRGNTDTIDLSKKIEDVINKYQKNYKDKGIDVVKVVDFTHYTKSLLNIVMSNAFIGFILVMVSLFIFLNFRTAIWVAAGIPLSILMAYIFCPAVGVTTNQITLITIIMVLGMLVDDAIVIAENINRHQEEGEEGEAAVIKGVSEVIRPVIATIVTTILCFVPMYFMKGILGKFIISIPTIVILTLGASLFESVSFLPYHLRKKGKSYQNRSSKLIAALNRIYSKILSICLKFKGTTLFFFLVMAIALSMTFKKYGRFELFPTNDFDIFYIVMETPVGSSLGETSTKVKQVEDLVTQLPKDQMIGYKTNIGDHRTDEAASDPALHENWALITVYLHPAAQRNTRSEDIIKYLKSKSDKINGFDRLDIREVQDGPPVGRPVSIRLISDKFELCEKFEKEIMNELKQIKGISDIESTNRVGKNEIRLKLKHEKMAGIGITAMMVADTIRVAYDGQIATSIRKNGEEIDFRVLLKDEQRANPNTLKKLNILNMSHRLVALEKIVDFEYGQAKQSINHFNGKKSILVSANNDNKVITSKEINEIIRSKFLKKIDTTPGITMEFGGVEKETVQSLENFFKAFVVAAICIYFVLVLLLNSFFEPFLIMIAIPFGLLGVLVAFITHGLPMSFLGLIGTLGMIGVVVNDSLVMVTYLNSLRDKYKKVDSTMILEGAQTRLRPVLLTTITTVLGLLPTVYGWGGYEPFLVPIVLAMSWGLALATFVTLFLVPILYGIFVRSPRNIPKTVD